MCLVSCRQYYTDETIIYQQQVQEIEVPETEPEEPKEIEVKKIELRPITEYPAYIVDQCNVLWGIPATLQGPKHKEKIDIVTVDGEVLPMSELDFFTLDGAVYIVHRYKTEDSKGDIAEAVDYYKQQGGSIERINTAPVMPPVSRATLDGTKWRIETSIINGTEFSYIYNLDPNMIQQQGNCGGKGARMGAYGMVSGFVELDKGLLVMTADESLFFPQNRACGNAVSERGRLWR